MKIEELKPGNIYYAYNQPGAHNLYKIISVDPGTIVVERIYAMGYTSRGTRKHGTAGMCYKFSFIWDTKEGLAHLEDKFYNWRPISTTKEKREFFSGVFMNSRIRVENESLYDAEKFV